MNTIRRRSFNPDLPPAMPAAADRALRFALAGPTLQRSGINDILSDHLRQLLDLVILFGGGQRLQVDSIQWINQAPSVTALYGSVEEKRQPIDLLDLYEPRLAYLRRVIESMLSVVELESKGQKLSVDGFRLRHPEQWLSPGGGPIDILAHAATRCNLKCRFCYNGGSPPAFKASARPAQDEYQEILARIDCYQPAGKLGLFPFTGSLCEPLNHPHINEILKNIRAKTEEVIRFPTNGSLLTAGTVEFLKKLMPLFVDVSLHSASTARRKWLMKDPDPQIAISAPDKLRTCGIPFSAVIVPWPFPSIPEMLDDLEYTIRFAQSCDPAFIQVSLPGYSRAFNPAGPLFDHDRVWGSLKDAVLELRKTTDCPIILRPGLYEEYTDPDRVDAPSVIGLVRGSPAAAAGMKAGDRLLSVNGLPVKTRVQARTLLSLIHQGELKTANLLIERCGRRIDLTVELDDFSYPFDYRSVPYLGVVFASGGIPIEWVEQLAQIVTSHRARDVLVLTSTLVRPTLEKHIRSHFFRSEVRLHLRVPENRSLGGNIIMGDLLTVDDFVAGVQDYLSEGNPRPDLIIVPSSPFHLSGWGRDLFGKVYLEIERRLGIAVALAQCSPIFD